MHLRPLAYAVSISLFAALAAPPAQAQKGKAKEPAAPTACTDYFAVANADWLAANPVAAGAQASALAELEARAEQQQRDLLDAAMQAPQGPVQQLLGDFWASGLAEAEVERDGANPVAPLLERINGIRRAKDIAPAIAALHQVGIPVAFNFGADIDLNDLDRHIGYFSQGGLGLVDPAYYTRTDADTKALLGRYNDYVQKILVLTGTPQDKAAAEAQLVLDLETRIAASSKPIVSLRDPRANYATVATASLGDSYERLQLDEFLRAQGVTDDTVSLANPALFAQLETLVNGLKPEQWKAYLRFHVGNAMAPYLSKAWRDTEFEFRGRVLRGETAPPPRWQQVLGAINTAAGPMLGREYAARYLSPEARSRAETVAAQVRDALGRAVDRSTLLSAAAKTEAKAKLAALQIEVGTPRRDLDYTIQPMGRGSFGGNMLIASTWRHREEMKRIGRGNADRRWDVLPQEPALAYDLAQNRLVVTAAMLQPSVLDMAREGAAHFGAFGALVGHELTHAVAGKGQLVDAAGNLRNWWTPVEQSAWESLAQRATVQYGGFEYPALQGIRVNGSQTRESNLADNAGLELALDAWRQGTPTPAKEATQAFYQAWAQLWAQQLSPEAATELASTSVHAPGKVRVNAALQNQPAFGEAFSCKAGTPMQAAEAARIRVWP